MAKPKYMPVVVGAVKRCDLSHVSAVEVDQRQQTAVVQIDPMCSHESMRVFQTIWLGEAAGRLPASVLPPFPAVANRSFPTVANRSFPSCGGKQHRRHEDDQAGYTIYCRKNSDLLSW